MSCARLNLRRVVLALVVLSIAELAGGCASQGEGWRLDRARELEEQGERDEAIAAYRAISESPREAWSISSAALADMTRLMLESVPRPLDADAVPRAIDTLERIHTTRSSGSRERSRALVQSSMRDWCNDLETDSQRDAAALLTLLFTASRLGVQSDVCESARRNSRAALSVAASEEWPLRMMRHHLAQPRDPGSVAALGSLLQQVAEYPLLVEENEALITQAVAFAGPGSPGGLAVREPLECRVQSPSDSPGNEGVEDSCDERLLAHLRALALAEERLAAGDVQGASEALEPLGGVGVRSGAALLLTSSVLDQLGDRGGAMGVLRVHVQRRMPLYRLLVAGVSARRAQVRVEVLARVEAGAADAVLQARLQGTTSEQAVSIVETHVSALLNEDYEMQALLPQLERESSTPRAALLLGILAVQSALDVSGDARADLLDEAESALRDAAAYAMGSSDYHLHLVILRLLQGRVDRSLAQLEALEASGDIESVERAQDLMLAYGVETGAPTAVAPAGSAMPGTSSPQAGQSTDHRIHGWPPPPRAPHPNTLRNAADYIRAEELRARGQWEEAAAMYLEVATRRLEAEPGKAGANNDTALALFRRHECSGNRWDIERAAELVHVALTRDSRSRVFALNAAVILSTLASVDTLSRWLPTGTLHVSASEASALLGYLARGSEGAAVREYYAGLRSVARSQDAIARLLMEHGREDILLTFRANHLGLTHNVAGLSALRQTLVDLAADAGGAGEDSALERARPDELARRNLDIRVARAQRRLRQARVESTPLAADAARVLLADALHRRATSEHSAADTAAALAQLDLVETPLLEVTGLRLSLYAVLVTLRCATQDSAMLFLNGEGRSYADSTMRLSALTSADARFAECARSELRGVEALPLLLRTQTPSARGWTLASLSGDERATQRHVEWASDDSGRLETDVAALIWRRGQSPPRLLRAPYD